MCASNQHMEKPLQKSEYRMETKWILQPKNVLVVDSVEIILWVKYDGRQNQKSSTQVAVKDYFYYYYYYYYTAKKY